MSAGQTGRQLTYPLTVLPLALVYPHRHVDRKRTVLFSSFRRCKFTCLGQVRNDLSSLCTSIIITATHCTVLNIDRNLDLARYQPQISFYLTSDLTASIRFSLGIILRGRLERERGGWGSDS
jgi:hypothetical protein